MRTVPKIMVEVKTEETGVNVRIDKWLKHAKREMEEMPQWNGEVGFEMEEMREIGEKVAEKEVEEYAERLEKWVRSVEAGLEEEKCRVLTEYGKV